MHKYIFSAELSFPHIFLFLPRKKKKKGKQAATGHIDMAILQVNTFNSSLVIKHLTNLFYILLTVGHFNNAHQFKTKPKLIIQREIHIAASCHCLLFKISYFIYKFFPIKMLTT